MKSQNKFSLVKIFFRQNVFIVKNQVGLCFPRLCVLLRKGVMGVGGGRGTKCVQVDAHSHIIIFLINTLEYLQGYNLTSCIVQINMAWQFKYNRVFEFFSGPINPPILSNK